MSVEDIERNIRNQQIQQKQPELNAKPATPINNIQQQQRQNLPMFMSQNAPAELQKNPTQRIPSDQRY